MDKNEPKLAFCGIQNRTAKTSFNCKYKPNVYMFDDALMAAGEMKLDAVKRQNLNLKHFCTFACDKY